jgi:uncharacterized protein YjbI with pentapeptide repeats
MHKFFLAGFIFAVMVSGGYTKGGDAEAIRAGKLVCPHCQLRDADLSNTCVKHGSLREADFTGAHAVLMCMSYADFTGASFRKTDLSGANLSHAVLNGADFTGAALTATLFKGTDLRFARGLTQKQLDAACGDDATKSPAGLTIPHC